MADTQPTEGGGDGPPNAEVVAVEAAPTQTVVRSPKALSQRDPMQIAAAFHASGFFPDVKSKAQAVVKIIAGEEIGIGPMAAIKGITVIEGQLGYTGNLIATLVKQHPTYDYKVVEKTNERCRLEFYDGDELLGDSEFSIEDAQRAGLVKPKSNWEKYPRAMCFNRALTEGVRAFIPDVTAGSPAYTDDEIEEVIEHGPVEAASADPTPKLSPETVEQLEKGLAAVGMGVEVLNVELGSLGIDGFDPAISLDQQLAGLTEEQAEALDARLNELANEELAEEVEHANA